MIRGGDRPGQGMRLRKRKRASGLIIKLDDGRKQAFWGGQEATTHLPAKRGDGMSKPAAEHRAGNSNGETWAA